MQQQLPAKSSVATVSRNNPFKAKTGTVTSAAKNS
jgi:hypothetical protein